MSAFPRMARIALAISLPLLASNAFGQIYVNGTLISGPTSESGVAAPAGTNWSEIQHDTGVTTEGNGSAGLSAYTGTFRAADDFVVPAGQTWTLTGIALFSYKTGSPATPSPFASYTLQIWNGRPGDAGATVLCGDTTTNVLTASTDTNLFRIFNSAVPAPGTTPGSTRRIWRNQVSIPAACAGTDFFTAGTYWISWDSADTAAGTHFDPAIVVPGARSRVGANARQQTVSTGVWTDALDAGAPATAPDVIQEFPFELLGTITLGDSIFAHGFET